MIDVPAPLEEFSSYYLACRRHKGDERRLAAAWRVEDRSERGVWIKTRSV